MVFENAYSIDTYDNKRRNTMDFCRAMALPGCTVSRGATLLDAWSAIRWSCYCLNLGKFGKILPITIEYNQLESIERFQHALRPTANLDTYTQWSRWGLHPIIHWR